MSAYWVLWISKNILASDHEPPLLKLFTHQHEHLSNFSFSSPVSRGDRGGVRAGGLPVRCSEAAVRVDAGEPVLHGGLQGNQEKPGPAV